MSSQVKIAGGVTALLAAVYVTTLVVLFFLMRASNEVAGKTLALVPGPAFMVLPLEAMWTRAREGGLEVGDEAPDFELSTLDRSARVRLSSLRHGKPVVLMFGSYTCPPFRREMPAMNKVYEAWRERASFYFVYIEEAHAHDVWPLQSNAKDNVVYAAARTAEERAGVATTCTQALRIPFAVLVDDIANPADSAYRAWPTRLYVVDPAGRVAWKSRPGPFGFEAAALEKALAALPATRP